MRTKEPKNLSPRIQWLRDYYFKGINRAWNNKFISFTTGTDWDELYEELSFYIVPETYAFFDPLRLGYRQNAYPVQLPDGFWNLSIVERRAWFVRECMVNKMPQEILPGDLIAGGRFSLMASRCWTRKEAAARSKLLHGKKGLRAQVFEYHDRGYGNLGPTSGHLIPDYARIVRDGFSSVEQHLNECYDALDEDKNSAQAAQLRAMLTSAGMAGELANKYADLCAQMSADEKDPVRAEELRVMECNLRRVPQEGARDFHEALQSLFLTHMLVLCDECYPGAGVSFGRIDQYLFPYWQKSLENGQDREYLKEILKCFFIKCNYAYDSMIYTGNNQGITAGFGQLFNLSGMGANGKDMTNDLTYAFLEVIDDLSPILEPKPNVRLHRNSPDELLDKVTGMIADCQGAPFLLNFDERSMAGLLREAERADLQEYINEDNVHDYACVGCLENTMVGNDRSGTVDINVNLLKAVELAYTGGADLITYTNAMGDKTYPQNPEKTLTPAVFTSFKDFYTAFVWQTRRILDKTAKLYGELDAVRAQFSPTPYLSCLVRGCAESGRDVTQGGAELKFVTVEGVTFATTVDSLLAVKYLVFDQKICTMDELLKALRDNWEGHDVLRAQARFKAPKYGRDDDKADALAKRVMDMWSEALWQYRTPSSGQRFRGGMLSWNYWVGDGYVLAASADGRAKGQFLSNAICPSNGADTNGPTANSNSVGKALGGKSADEGDYAEYLNCLPNGASHTITFGLSFLRDSEHREKFKSFLRGYCENGGTALQINVLDADMLRDAQKNPDNYRHLLVRVTGYNAYFTAVGRELQDEIIARESHNKW